MNPATDAQAATNEPCLHADIAEEPRVMMHSSGIHVTQTVDRCTACGKQGARGDLQRREQDRLRHEERYACKRCGRAVAEIDAVVYRDTAVCRDCLGNDERARFFGDTTAEGTS